MRYERKYRIEGVERQVILQVLRLHPAGLVPLYPDRQINNIYFDTPDLTTYKENVMGIANRDKFRVRWYGSDLEKVVRPTLEIKHRRNNVGNKTLYPLPAFDLNDLLPLTQLINRHSGTTAALFPTLQNSYKRAYFSTRDLRFRVTLDWDLAYASLRACRRFRRHQYKEPHVHILELKYHRSLEVEADRITQFLPFRSTKNSKYVTGVGACW